MEDWVHKQIIIAPSVLAADFGRIEEECDRATEAGADWLHLDIMDGHFVDNISFGPAIVESINQCCTLFLDVHLMISFPCRYIQRFAEAGAKLITIHLEAEDSIPDCLQQIKNLGCLCGLAINPATDLEKAIPYFDQIDLLLCMTVVPGFGGQAFLPEVLTKISKAAMIRDSSGHSFHIEVDGGINSETAKLAKAAGANVLVAGSSTFGSIIMADAIESLRRE